MLTEVKKTIHIVVDNINAVPEENLLARTIMHDGRTFDECGDAMHAAAELKKAQWTYHVWTVDMRFTRDCAFEPRTAKQSAKSIVQHVNDLCRKMAEAILENVPEPDKIASMSEDAVTEKLHELFEDGMFSLSD